MLDVRGNGGGSTDGAIDALGLFIPGAPLFPMKRRDGSLETDRAPEPPGVDRWNGPVATLVDGDTASAAEMIAGALARTAAARRSARRRSERDARRSTSTTTRKRASCGLTTLLYALPDGTPVQRVGLAPPSASLSGPPTRAIAKRPCRTRRQRGADPTCAIARCSRTPKTAPGARRGHVHGGNVGPCKEAEVCRALRLLGTNGPTARRPSAPKGR